MKRCPHCKKSFRLIAKKKDIRPGNTVYRATGVLVKILAVGNTSFLAKHPYLPKDIKCSLNETYYLEPR